MDRRSALDAILAALLERRREAVAAARFARETATAKENVAENKYDTLGLEAAYLAQSQSARAEELGADIDAFESLASMSRVDTCRLGTLVKLAADDARARYLFIGPGQGGLRVRVGGETVAVVTPDAPVGRALLGQGVGDELDVAGEILEVVEIA